MTQRIALIGPGRVGCAITRCLHDAGYPVVAIIGRCREKSVEACEFIGCSEKLASDQLSDAATAQLILLAVPDDQIKNVAMELHAAIGESNHTIIHFSGLHSADIMRHEPSRSSLLSLHPLLPFADRQIAFENLKHCPCALEGDPSALSLGQEVVKAIGGQAFLLSGDKKTLYHAAACIASNYLVTLLACSRDLLVSCGVAQEQTLALLRPLMQASLDNAIKLGPEQGLTGPIVRGDIGTLENHLEALKSHSPDDHQLYILLGLKTLSLARQSNRLINQETVTAIDHLLTP